MEQARRHEPVRAAASRSRNPLEQRLRASPYFHAASDPSGRPYVAQDVEPYTHYWLTERYRLLWSMFAGRKAVSASEAISAYLRCTGTAPENQASLGAAVAKMRTAGLLVATEDDPSRYDASLVDDYLEHRPIPAAVSDHIITEGKLRRGRRALDIAGGPGDLALTMARTKAAVTLLELSRGFLASAGARAKARGLELALLQESANKLRFREDEYDVVTVSQALHWLDDLAVCRGLYATLAPGGSFFVVEAKTEVAPSHPLATVLDITGSFRTSVNASARRLRLLFRALDSRDIERVERGTAKPAGAIVGPVGIRWFKERRTFPIGYARAFFTRQHVAEQLELRGKDPEDQDAFWDDLRARYAAAAPADLVGTERWAVLHFQRQRE